MAAQRPPRVFISYSHDSEAHAARVLQLANDLRRDGVETILDQYLTSPPEGWHRWMDGQIRDADFVVMVCTETYYRRVIGKEKPGEGLGVRWEGNLIYAHLYGSGVDLSRFVPVLTEGSGPSHIPEAVLGSSLYFIEKKTGYEGVLRRLFNQTAAEMPLVGTRPPLPALSPHWHQRPLGALHGVPELPPHFVPRADILNGLREKLLAAHAGAIGVTGAAVKVGVQGMGGIGKSVLAVALARDEAIREAFPASVFWVPLGEVPDLVTRQSDLHRQLTGQPGNFTDAQQGKVTLQEALHGRTCLVVLDDVWRMADAEVFNVIDGQARLLLTTRDAAIVKSLGAREHRVEVLDRPASLRLLAQASGVAEASLPDEADAIAEECGDLPLALALAGGMIGGQADMWRLVFDALRNADIEQIEGEFPGYPYPHVFAAIEASVNALKDDRERYLDLAIFPEDVPIPESVLKALWGIGALRARSLINRLRDRSLATLDEHNRLSLHDLQCDFVRKRAEDQPARHQRLLEAWRQQCPSGWASGPGDADNGYFFRYLPLHLAQAGREDDLRELLLDYAWIKAKLAAADVPTLLSDYAHTVDSDAALMHRALMLSAHIIARDKPQLPAQIAGRLRDSGRPRIDKLVMGLKAECQHRWLCPHRRSLTPPGALLRTFGGHGSSVRAVAVLVDGWRVLSGSDDGAVRLWDVETGTELRHFAGHQRAVRAVAALADGRRLLSCSDDGTVRLWDVEAGTQLRRFADHQRPVRSVAVLPDGRRVLSGAFDGTVRLWDVETATEVRRFLGHKGEVMSVAVLADGRHVLSGSADQTVRLWDVEAGTELRRFEGHDGWISTVAVLTDGARVLSGSFDRTVRLWDVKTGMELRRFEGHDGWISTVAALADGRHVLSGSFDGTVRLWDVETATERRRFPGHGNTASSVVVLADGQRVLCGSDDGTVRLWDVKTETELHSFPGHESRVTSVAVQADGQCVLSGSSDGTLRLWDLETERELRRFAGHGNRVTSVAVQADGRRVLSGSADRTLRLWDVETGTELRCFAGHGDRVTSVAVVADGRRVLSGSWDRTLRLWDVETGRELRCFMGHQREVTSVAMLADGRRVLSASPDRTLRLWDVETGRELRCFTGHSGWVSTIAVLTDGWRALFGSYDGTVGLWDVEREGVLRRCFEGHEGSVLAVAAVADGRRALSGSEDRTVRLWDLETGECLATFTGDAAITCVAVARDDLFVAGSANGAVHFLELRGPRLDL